MPHYHRLGTIPHKRHTQFRKPDGGLYAEQLLSTEGFSDLCSLAYHCQPPTRVLEVEEGYPMAPEVVLEKNLRHRAFQGFSIKPVDDYLESRVPVFVNEDLYIELAAPRRSMEHYFFRNGDAHEMIFVHEGSGVLHTLLGKIPFREGDHLLIPRGITYRMEFGSDANRLFILQSFSAIRYPERYTNRSGQLLEHSPYCERDIRPPEALEVHEETGDFLVLVKKQDMLYPYHYGTHPFDVVGWDGYHYPFAFSIHDFEPVTGRVHQPPPVHQTFEARGFVTCAFVPRMFDYHPEAIAVPYNHTNVDADEVLYYVDGDFFSRKNVSRGMISLHPIGIPHGPHPGAVEKGLGARETNEYAVMVDSFRPLRLTRQALEIEDPAYYRSWNPS